MKIKADHFALLKQAIVPLDTNENRQMYVAARLSDKRYRWDLLRAARIDGMNGISWACAVLYPYMNDDHIDTALRRIVPDKALG